MANFLESMEDSGEQALKKNENPKQVKFASDSEESDQRPEELAKSVKSVAWEIPSTEEE